jgi:4-amino-4-deoxy-L-arabinose transferase-like glycosyltransferase
MRRWFEGRAGHYGLLVGVTAVLCLPNLGRPSLWDIDEGHNAEAAREMLVSGNWIVPTFNFKLRVDKPALLYWCQATAFQFLGVNEFAARLPSVLAALAAVLLTYELGRRQFGAGTGLLASVILASTILYCAAAHFANPDALLTACTTLTLYCFWRGQQNPPRRWAVPAGISAGLAVLAKGPIGFVLPAGIVLVYLLWTRQLRTLWQRQVVLGFLAFLLVAAPWYALVTAETKADFLRGFWFTHNVGRFLQPMENHRGPLYYYLIVVPLGFAPWSVFLGLVGWNGFQEAREPASGENTPFATRFLIVWVAVPLVFFSLSGTKLPNYVLPIYPALALLTGRALQRWLTGAVRVGARPVLLCLGVLALAGVLITTGLLIAAGQIPLAVLRGRYLPDLARWAALGGIPLGGAIGAAWFALHGRRHAVIGAVAVSAVLFTASVAAWVAPAVDAYKAPRELARAGRVESIDKEIRIGCYQYYQPSLVFYCGTEVLRLGDETSVRDFLSYPFENYLLLPVAAWEGLAGRVDPGYRVIARHYDLYRHTEVLLVSNRRDGS